MTNIFLWASFIAAIVAQDGAQSGVKTARDGMLEVGGKRTFILGLYENPGDDAVLDQVAKAGFNLVHATPDVAALDRLHARGLGAWVNLGGAIDQSADREKREAALEDMARRLAGHPAFRVWEVPDEALWNCWHLALEWRLWQEGGKLSEEMQSCADAALVAEMKGLIAKSQEHYARGEFAEGEAAADGVWAKLGKTSPHPGLNISNAPQRAATMCKGLIEGRARLKALDPAHPVWMNHAPRNTISQLAAFNAAADIVGCDIYPVPEFQTGHSDLPDRSLASVGAYTDRMMAAAPGKPAWMVLQGFGWADLREKPTPEEKEKSRRPTYEESRFMAYDAIVHRARGILYWGTYRIERDSQLWNDLLTLVRELADMEPILSAPDVESPIEVSVSESWGSLEKGVVALGKNVGGRTWLVVVNEYPGALRYKARGLKGMEGVFYSDNLAGVRAQVKDGALELNIRGSGVQILRPE
ncbi:MAG TPA: hypothetical protein PL033_08880 [Candidatus Brocadiia bacterium]|nr:hypothetical protein [Candidatus Brocadiia bacterium]